MVLMYNVTETSTLSVKMINLMQVAIFMIMLTVAMNVSIPTQD